MFVRFRRVRHRLIVDLVDSHRVGRKVSGEHIARLGSVALPEPVSASERVRFWRELRKRFRDIAVRLANRVTAEDRRKALGLVHKRIPKPTAADEQAARIETARDDVRFWELVRDGSSTEADINKARRRLIAAAEKQIAKDRALAEMAERQIAEAQRRFMKLTRGERAAGDDDPPARQQAATLIARAAVRDGAAA
jgi:hypothetical protein